MNLKTFFLAVGVALAALVPTVAFASAAAVANDVHVTGVDLRPLLQEVLLVLGSIASVLALWALRAVGAFIRTKTGVNIMAQEDMLRKYMESALQSGLKYASTQVDSATWAHVDTKNAMLNMAAEYVLASVPDAVAYFKLDKEGLMTRL